MILGIASVIPCRTAASDKLWIEDVCVLEHAMTDAGTLFRKRNFMAYVTSVNL